MKINIVSKLMEAYAQTPSPFTQSTFKSQGNFDYIAGAFFIALALLAAFFIKRAKENLKKYKVEQLKVYNENNKTKPALNYESTSLYIPFWERIKSIAPVMLMLLFAFVAITFFVGHPIQTL